MGQRVVFWRPMYDPAGAELMEAGGLDVDIVDSSDPADVVAALDGARALWVRTPERVTADVLEAGKDLVVVSTSGFGTDNVDIDKATELGIAVINNPGFGRIPVAEHTVMMMLAVTKQIVWSDRTSRDGTAWDQRTGLEFFELEGKTIGLVGLGFIGSEVARKLSVAFNCNVIAYDPYVDPRIALLTNVEMTATLDDLLERSRFLVLCPELTTDTTSAIGPDELAKLQPGTFVINTSRGAVLDLDALSDALDSGHIAGAGLDVVYPEPLPAGHRLLSNDKVVFTPHTGGLSVETSTRLAHAAADQITTVLAGGQPNYLVNPDAWSSIQSRRPTST